MNISLGFAKLAHEIMKDRYCQLEEITGTLVAVASRNTDGKLTIVESGVKHRLYSTNYWKSQPNGEYSIFMTQGGIRNRDIPKDEKRELARFLSLHLRNHEDIDVRFSGILTLHVFNGDITSIVIEHK